MYKLKINDPKSDNEAKITGTINRFVSEMQGVFTGSSNVYSVGKLVGLPNPFSNSTGNVINIPSIDITTNIINYDNKQLTLELEESDIANVVDLLRSQFLMTYEFSIDLIVYKEEDKPLSGNEQTLQPLIKNEVISENDGNKILEYIFNIETENTFTNSDLGTLTIVSKDEDSYIFGDEDPTIDPEYLEAEFSGQDEDPFILPIEDIIEFESALESGSIDIGVLEENNTKPTNPGTPENNMKLIAQAARELGLKSKYAIYSMIAIASGECGLKPQEEGHKYTLSNVSRVFSGMSSDQKVRASKSGLSKRQFFSIVYGEYKPSRVGNRNVPDGGLYYGRGFIQLTGYENYVRYNNLLKKKFPNENADIIRNPDLVNDPKICAKLVALYFLDRVNTSQNSSYYLESALKAVGRDANGGYAKKRQFYNKLMSSNKAL